MNFTMPFRPEALLHPDPDSCRYGQDILHDGGSGAIKSQGRTFLQETPEISKPVA